MPENTARLTTITPNTPLDGHVSASKPIWERQKHEPALWYMRFKRYLEMGPKRSLRAVYVAEPSAQKATKKLDAPEKPLSDVSVPGSWTRAAKVWNWTTRAREYDLAQMEKQAARIRAIAEKQPHASRSYRLISLNECACILRRTLEQTKQVPTDKIPTYLAIMARYQSIMRDIAKELEGVELTDLCDATAMRKVDEERIERKYKKDMKSKNMHNAYALMRELDKLPPDYEELLQQMTDRPTIKDRPVGTSITEQ